MYTELEYMVVTSRPSPSPHIRMIPLALTLFIATIIFIYINNKTLCKQTKKEYKHYL